MIHHHLASCPAQVWVQCIALHALPDRTITHMRAVRVRVRVQELRAAHHSLCSQVYLVLRCLTECGRVHPGCRTTAVGQTLASSARNAGEHQGLRHLLHSYQPLHGHDLTAHVYSYRGPSLTDVYRCHPRGAISGVCPRPHGNTGLSQGPHGVEPSSGYSTRVVWALPEYNYLMPTATDPGDAHHDERGGGPSPERWSPEVRGLPTAQISLLWMAYAAMPPWHRMHRCKRTTESQQVRMRMHTLTRYALHHYDMALSNHADPRRENRRVNQNSLPKILQSRHGSDRDHCPREWCCTWLARLLAAYQGGHSRLGM